MTAPGWRHEEIERKTSLRYQTSASVDAEPIFVASNMALGATSQAATYGRVASHGYGTVSRG